MEGTPTPAPPNRSGGLLRAAAAAVLLPAAVAGAILAANRFGTGHPSLAGAVPAGPSAPVTVSVAGPGPSVRSGELIRAEVSIFNHTDRTLKGGCPLGTWPHVGLEAAGLEDFGWSDLMPCTPVALPPGLSRFEVSVPTTYRQCGLSGSSSTPRCLPGPSMPPLPPGTYRLRLTGAGLPAGTALPAPLAIILRP